MKTKADKKVSKVMREYKAGTLNSGTKTGPVVKSRKQAIAIALNTARTAAMKAGKPSKAPAKKGMR